ncbi:MAG: bifunctional folylpolyglutamate synthase/dihydrofolate synthase, partial [Lachnospiraceae bacterium]|nr:bifunctional folylpolyglutamate synthase/dihydrofolate synthase [Lachnospiraceae bacterium]
MTYEAFITWLEKVPLYGHKDGINNIRKLLARLGHPEKCAPVIHVAGTNGKGSCCAMMASVLQRSGMKVGLFTSPHLVTYGERIRVDGINISEEELVRLGLEVKKQLEEMVAAGENHCTFFEILTAIGFLYFAREQVDVIVLEVGVGGRLDATNVVEEPALCLIASISLDHTKVLGDTLEAIAAEKAGILKAGRPVVLSENPLCVQQVVETAAREKGCPFIYAPSFESGASDYPIPLAGNYQKQNRRAAVTALRLLQQQGFPITEESLREGLARTDWPGRMQTLQVEGQTVLMDGAHNPGGARMLADYLDQSYAPGSCTLVFSALGKKDLSGILQPLAE